MTTKEICLFCCVSKVCKEIGYSSWNYGSIICAGLSPRAIRSVLSRLSAAQGVLHLSLWRVKDPAPIDLDAVQVVGISTSFSPASPKRWVLDVAEKGYLLELLTLDFQDCTWVDFEFLAVLSEFCPKLQHVDARGTGLEKRRKALWTLWPRLQCFEVRPSLYRELFETSRLCRTSLRSTAPRPIDSQSEDLGRLIAITSRHEQPGLLNN
eukprot:2110865-Rhodomonas_salina.1